MGGIVAENVRAGISEVNDPHLFDPVADAAKKAGAAIGTGGGDGGTGGGDGGKAAAAFKKLQEQLAAQRDKLLQNDLAKDQGETTDLAAREPAVVARLTSAVLAWHRSLPADNGPALGAASGKAGAKKKKK